MEWKAKGRNNWKVNRPSGWNLKNKKIQKKERKKDTNERKKEKRKIERI